jgi:hypothetical protein
MGKAGAIIGVFGFGIVKDKPPPTLASTSAGPAPPPGAPPRLITWRGFGATKCALCDYYEEGIAGFPTYDELVM